jgi:hypothetical protein
MAQSLKQICFKVSVENDISHPDLDTGFADLYEKWRLGVFVEYPYGSEKRIDVRISGVLVDSYYNCVHCGMRKNYFSCESCDTHPCGMYGCGSLVNGTDYCLKHTIDH